MKHHDKFLINQKPRICRTIAFVLALLFFGIVFPFGAVGERLQTAYALAPIRTATTPSFNVTINIANGFSLMYGTQIDDISIEAISGNAVVINSNVVYVTTVGSGAHVFCNHEEVIAFEGIYTIFNLTDNSIIEVSSLISLDISYGSIIIGETVGSDRIYKYYDNSGTLQSGTHVALNRYRIVGTSGTISAGGQSNVTIVGSGDFNVILDNVSIYTGINKNVGWASPFATNGVTAGFININLVGVNNLYNTSENTSSSYAGLEKTGSYECTLAIRGNGTLNAVGGYDSAGIGGSDLWGGATSNIHIYSGTIYATSLGSQGAGIGSGNNQEAQNIRIYGGNITAVAAENGAGIGGSGGISATGALGVVYIYGGTISATSSALGAGIGGGGSGGSGGPGYVYIYDGLITTSSIGGGQGGLENGGNAVVEIHGGDIVVSGMIGICGGDSTNANGGTITVNITGGNVTADTISGGTGASGEATGSVAISGGSVNVENLGDNTITVGSDGTSPVAIRAITIPGINEVVLVTDIVVVDGEGTAYPYGADVYSDQHGTILLWLPDDCTVQSVQTSVAGVETDNTITSNTAGFTISIPDSFTVVGSSGYFELSAEILNFLPSQQVTITVTVDSIDQKLKLAGVPTVTLDYSLYSDSEHTQSIVADGSGVVAVFVGNCTSTIRIYYTVDSTPLYSGVYSDTLSFTVTVASSV